MEWSLFDLYYSSQVSNHPSLGCLKIEGLYVGDIEQSIGLKGRQIAEQLNHHNWTEAAQSLLICAYQLNREQFKSLTQEIMRNDKMGEGIDIRPFLAEGEYRTDITVHTHKGIWGRAVESQYLPKLILDLGEVYDRHAREK